MTHRILLTFSMLSLAIGTAAAVAQTPPAPWEGEISGNNVNVRSGEATRYYATCKLNAGDRVLVLGESNGWYKILPPANSFSYIDKTAIERHTKDIGSVSRDKAYVRAGSHISRRKSRTQVILGRGDPVVILGEIDGFFKIEPPKRAVLFVARDFVRPIPKGQESGLLKHYSAADWANAGNAEPDAKAASSPELTAAGETAPITTAVEPERELRLPPSADTRNVEERTSEPPPITANQPIATNVEARPIETRAVDTPTFAPPHDNFQHGGTTHDTLVLSPGNPSTPASNTRFTTESSSHEATNTGSTYTTVHSEPATASSYADPTFDQSENRAELIPADRSPPASVPDWAQVEDSDRLRSSRVTSREYENRTYTTGRTTEPSGDARVTRRSTAINRDPYVAPKMGTMVEITSNTPRTTRPDYAPPQPTIVASTPQPTGVGTRITQYERRDSDTLMLNASDTPVASHAPTTRLDMSNAHPSGNYSETHERTTTTTTYGETQYTNVDSTQYHAQTEPVETSIPIPSTPPPEVPIDPNSGPYAARLVELEGELHAIMSLPIKQRPYSRLIQNYEEISMQTSERVPSEYAAIRVGQIQALERVQKLAVRYASDRQGLDHFSRRMDEERLEIRQANQRRIAGSGSGAFEYEGLLMRSYAFSPEKRRYRLVDPGTQSTVIYVDIPVAVLANPDTLTGRQVGIRIGSRQYSEAAQIPIVEAAAIVDLTAPPTKYQPISAPAIRNSAQISNPANTRGNYPNPLIEEPVAREQSGSGSMGDMELIKS